MKKIITLLVAIVAIGALGYYAINLNKNKGKSDTELIEFSLEETESVDKVIISDPQGNVMEVIKTDSGIWTDKDGGCISQESIGYILHAFKNIEFKGYLAESTKETFKTKIASQHTKIEIFQDGEWTKTWFMGPSSQDHYGQVMLLDTKDYGKSGYPVIMKIKGVHGIISPIFYADARKWMCSEIFKLELDEIKQVDVKMNEEPTRSFTVDYSASKIAVSQNGRTLPNIDTSMVFRYLNNYKKIHFLKANYVLKPMQIDSMMRTTPFAEITISKSNGEKSSTKCYRIKHKEYSQEGVMKIENIDEGNFWAELDNGQIVKCQYYVFNPLILGQIYFPFDNSGFKTVDGTKVVTE